MHSNPVKDTTYYKMHYLIWRPALRDPKNAGCVGEKELLRRRLIRYRPGRFVLILILRGSVIVLRDYRYYALAIGFSCGFDPRANQRECKISQADLRNFPGESGNLARQSPLDEVFLSRKFP